jgi:hypothetical protein
MADPKDIKEAKRVTQMFKRIAGEMAKRPGLVKAGKGAIGVADLFAPVPGGKARSMMRLKKMTDVVSKSAWKKIAAKRAAKNEAEKAALAAGGLGYAVAKNKKK